MPVTLAVQLSTVGIHRTDLQRVPEPILVVNHVRGMAAIAERNTDDGHGDRLKERLKMHDPATPYSTPEGMHMKASWYHISVSVGLFSNHPYMHGMSSSVSSVDVIKPPTTTVASGFWISEPAPLA